MEKILTSKKRIIKFTNTKAVRVGKGIRALRNRINMSLERLAEVVGISRHYLNRLEEGYEPEVERWILESIAQTVRVCKRGNKLTDDKLVDIFLCAASEAPPKLF